MNKALAISARRYAAALRRYWADEQEAVLEEAYELGRSAVASGLGVLDMARTHQHALAQSLRPPLSRQNHSGALRAAETFFLESLSPFEVMHRGFRETNLKLQQLIQTLKGRNLELAVMNGELAREITEHKRTEQALRAQEEERKTISRELHDEVGQALTAISMNLAAVRSHGRPGSDDFHQRIADTQGLLRQLMQSVHDFARELRPAMIDELGLLPALRCHLRSFAERTGLQVHFGASPRAECLNAEQKTALFRVAQESLNNVAKHARASRVAVSIRPLRSVIRLEIRDNGQSFHPGVSGRARQGKRLGLLGMQERVRLVNGKFAVVARPGKGTTVRVEIPCKPAAARTPPTRPATIVLAANGSVPNS